MKKLILLSFIIFLMSGMRSQAQTYYKLHKGGTLKQLKMEAQYPQVSIKFAPVTFQQANFVTSFNEVTYHGGKFAANANTISFTPNYTFGSANATVTATQSGDTIYHLSQILAYGGGVTISDNIITGKVGVAPSVIAQIGSSYAVVIGYDLVNKYVVGGISLSVGDILNKLTKISNK